LSSSVIGALRVNLGVDSAAFSSGLKKSEGGLKKFAAGAAKGIAVAAAAFSAAAAGVALAVRGILNEADQMGKSAQSLGIPVEELSRLKHAAEMSGSSMEGLSTAVKRLGANISEAVTKPTGAAGQAFQKLGIDLKNTDGTLKNSSQVMSDLAEKLSQMPDGAEKTALAMQLMGKSGADLIPMLNGGRDALQAMKDEADELGIVIDQKTATAAANFNDGLARLGKMLTGIWTKLTAELAPALAAIVGYFVDAAKNSNGFGAVISNVAQMAVDGALFVIDAWHGLKLVFPALEVAATAFGNVLMTIARTATNAITGMVDSMIDGINSGVRGMNALIGTSFQEMKKLGESEWFANSQKQADDAAMSFARARLRLGMLMNEPMPSEGIRAAIAEMQNAGNSATDAGKAFTAAGEEIVETSTRIGGGARGAAGAVRELADESKQLKDVGADLSQSLGQQFSSMFEGLITGTKSAGEAIKGLLQNLAKLLINRAFNALFAGFGGGGGFLSGLFGGFRASGGPVSGGKAYVVGERGPELMVPNMSGTVIPNHALNDNSAGGGHVSVSLTLSDDLDARIESTSGRVSAQIVQANNRQIPAILSNSQRRSG
jgi:hypothetical protein